MGEALTSIDLDAPPERELEDDSLEGILKQSKVRVMRANAQVRRNWEHRLALVYEAWREFDSDEKDKLGKVSKYYFKMKYLPRSHMGTLRSLVIKYQKFLLSVHGLSDACQTELGRILNGGKHE